jgi:hypothetical protein
MPAIYRRLGKQTLELCNGRRVNSYHIVDACVLREERSLFRVGPFLWSWLIAGFIVNAAMGANAKSGTYDSVQGTISLIGFCLPLVLFVKRKHSMVRITGSSGEVLLLMDIPEGEATAHEMVDGLMYEVEQSASYNMIEPYRDL